MDPVNKPLFRELNASDEDQEITEIESVCMNCFKNGTTRLLLTKIPFYKEVIIMSFACDSCGCRNNEIQSSSEIQANGIKIEFTVTDPKDLNRRIVKSDFTALRIEELDFDIPAQSQKGEVTTIEGILERAITALEQDQIPRRNDHPEIATQIDEFIEKIKKLKDQKFTIKLEDISGNCFIENTNAPHTDPSMKTTHFKRTSDQDHLLGIFNEAEISNDFKKKAKVKDGLLHPIEEGEWNLEELHGEVLQFHTNCPECQVPCDTNMKLTSIPHFKDVLIMATVCDACGSKTNEVKSGGGIDEFGVKFEVKINSRDDFSRDILKSETCSLCIPELDCEVGSYAITSRFTTVEGIVEAMKDQLTDRGVMFRDSQDAETKQRYEFFLDSLDEILAGTKKVTLVLDDPAGNSYVQSLTDDVADDQNLTVTKYTRTYEQNEELGLNDMKTENYETED